MDQALVADILPNICQISWLPEDQLEELDNIVQGAAVSDVQKKFSLYVEENIEPAGWQAVWRSPGTSTKLPMILQKSMDFSVDVIHVTPKSLEATFILQCILGCRNIENSTSIHGLEISAPLFQLHPLANQENEAVNIHLTAEVLEQLRFFYDHIWCPWDLYDEHFIYDKYLLKERLDIYEEIRSQIIPHNIGQEMRSLWQEGSNIQLRIESIEKRAGLGHGGETDIDERDFSDLLQLNKQMDRLKVRFDFLRDPATRKFADHQVHLEQLSVMATLVKDSSASIKLVASSVSLNELKEGIQLMESALQEIPSPPFRPNIQTFPTLQTALDASSTGDIVFLLPGSYTLTCLGPLANGGTIYGLGEGVEIIGGSSTGEVLLDLYPKQCPFILSTVSLEPAGQQIGIVIHEGEATIKKLKIKGGKQGLICLKGSRCNLQDTKILSCMSSGLACLEESFVAANRLSIMNCGSSGLLYEENGKISVVNSSITNNVIGVEILTENENLHYRNLDSIIEKIFDVFSESEINSNEKLVKVTLNN